MTNFNSSWNNLTLFLLLDTVCTINIFVPFLSLFLSHYLASCLPNCCMRGNFWFLAFFVYQNFMIKCPEWAVLNKTSEWITLFPNISSIIKCFFTHLMTFFSLFCSHFCFFICRHCEVYFSVCFIIYWKIMPAVCEGHREVCCSCLLGYLFGYVPALCQGLRLLVQHWQLINLNFADWFNFTGRSQCFSISVAWLCSPFHNFSG